MKRLLKELLRVSGCGIGFAHLAPYRRYDLREWCRQALSLGVVLDYVVAT